MTTQGVNFEDVRTALDDGRNFSRIRNSPWYLDSVYDKFSDAEYQRRWSAVREKMAELGLDCIITGGGPSHWSYGYGMLWLSGHWEFHGTAVYVVFPKEGEPTLVYGQAGTHAEAVRRIVSMKDVRTGGARAMQVAVERIKELGLENGTIGITVIDPIYMDYMPFNQYNALREGLPNAKFELLGDFFHQFMMVKSPEEQEWVAKAGALCVNAAKAMAARAAPGVADYQLVAAAVHALMDGGGMADFINLGSTPMSDPKMSFPNPKPSGRKMQKGDIIIMEVSGGYGGYTAHIGTAITLGEPTEEVRYLFDQVVVPGFKKLADTIRPGKRYSDTHEAGKFFREVGYQSRPVHLHVLDLVTHAPHITTAPPEHDAEWVPGIAVGLDPAPMLPDGSLGILFSRTLIVTDGDPRDVTPYPMELDVVDC